MDVALRISTKKVAWKSVFRVLLVMQHPAAQSKHQWPVPLDQDGESPIVATGKEILQQLVLGHFFGRPQSD